jgi:hypothetical protein
MSLARVSTDESRVKCPYSVMLKGLYILNEVSTDIQDLGVSWLRYTRSRINKLSINYIQLLISLWLFLFPIFLFAVQQK